MADCVSHLGTDGAFHYPGLIAQGLPMVPRDGPAAVASINPQLSWPAPPLASFHDRLRQYLVPMYDPNGLRTPSPPVSPPDRDAADHTTPRHRRLLRVAIEENIRAEEQRIYEAQERIRLLQTDRNRTVPVARLPAELLTETFLLVRDNTNDLEWLPCILHVCTAWRAYALSFRLLWSRIRVRDHETTKIQLERSGVTPLTLRIVLKSKPDPAVQRDRQRAVAAALNQIARVRHLSIKFHELYPDSERRKLQPYFQRPAPLMESLAVNARNFMGRLALFPLPQHLFARAAPRLNSIEYFNCAHHTPIELFLNLRRLTVCFDSDGLPTPIPARGCTELLCNLPLLEELNLYRGLPPGFRGPDDPPPDPTDPNADTGVPFAIPRLRKLYLEDEHDLARKFLQRLAPPPPGVTRQVDVRCFADPRIDDVTPVVAALAPHVAAGARGAWLGYAYGRPHARLSVQLFSDPARWNKRTRTTRLVFAFSGHHEPALAPAVLAACAHLPLGTVERAHVEYLHPLTRGQWADALRALPALRVLSSAESPAVRLVSSLAEDAVNTVRDGTAAPVLPALERLAIDRISLKTVYPCSTTREAFAADVRRLVLARTKCGCPLRELVLQRVRDVQPETRAVLADIVETVKYEDEGMQLFEDDYRQDSPLGDEEDEI